MHAAQQDQSLHCRRDRGARAPLLNAVSEPLMTSRSDPEYCCRQAETCHEMAEKATDPRDREGWLRLAQDWIELAEQGGGQVGKKALYRRGRSKVGKNPLARGGL
jgi:hypothetical protein